MSPQLLSFPSLFCSICLHLCKTSESSRQGRVPVLASFCYFQTQRKHRASQHELTQQLPRGDGYLEQAVVTTLESMESKSRGAHEPLESKL